MFTNSWNSSQEASLCCMDDACLPLSDPGAGHMLGGILRFYRWDLRPLAMKGLATVQLWGSAAWPGLGGPMETRPTGIWHSRRGLS